MANILDQLIDYYSHKDKGLLRILLTGILVVIFIWSSTFIINAFILYEKDAFNGGTLGDSFGMVNALFSALAFALLIYTALMQKEELKLQRKELKDNRKELKRSADAHRELVKLTTAQLELTTKLNKQILLAKLNLEDLRLIDRRTALHTAVLKILNDNIKITSIKASSFNLVNTERLLKSFNENESFHIQFIGPRAGNRTININFETQEGKFKQTITISKEDYKISSPSVV
ncbi:MAG: hypothetical protein RLO17_22995 [Cyclobacteriaceae bacterium]